MKEFFVNPVIWLFGAIILAPLLSRRWPRAARIFLVSVISSVYALSTPYLASRIMRALENTASRIGASDEKEPEAIVVLGAGLAVKAPEFGGITLDSLSLVRIRYGARLHVQTELPILVAGGHWAGIKIPLAAYMKRVLLEEFNVPTKWIENRSRNTYENGSESAKILRRSKINSIYLVTHAFHMRRAVTVFEKQGFTVTPAPTGHAYVDDTPNFVHFIPSIKALAQSRYVIHELVAQVWYRIRYY